MALRDRNGPVQAETGYEPPFRPRPEARPLPWSELLSSTFHATRDLLLWLKAAVDSSSASHEGEQLATSLLISGDRGSGKTTVLMTTAYALQKLDDFIPEPQRASTEAGSIGDVIEKIRDRIVWLDTLDLEPLPQQANLLATLLVRVRAALGTGLKGAEHERWTPTSILEREGATPWGLLDQLIRDATFMWEDISGTDTRQRAEQQIKAADIYSQFQRHFRDAMEQVARALALVEFGQHGRKGHERIILVLPIDNVDRSIEHLHLILKLTRMVACPQLWFLLAAGRSDFQLFLERSFQMELLEAGKAGLGPRGEDETLSIARRQAAAGMRRVLPPSHRLELEPVSAGEAWTFVASELSANSKELSELLHELPLVSGRQGDQEEPVTSFAHLLDIGQRLDDKLKEDSRGWEEAQGGPAFQCREEGRIRAARTRQRGGAAPFFTHAGKLALTMPARNLLDLYQLASREVELLKSSSHPRKTEAAIRLATSMLRGAIDESDLPGWASDQLQRRIIRRNVQGDTILDLTGNPVRRFRLMPLSEALEWPSCESPSGQSCGLLGTGLHLRRFQELTLELSDLDGSGNHVPLPPHVTGWFMLLHDLLVFSDELRLLKGVALPFEMSPHFVGTLQQGMLGRLNLVQLDFWWDLPHWNAFTDFAIFAAQWRAFLTRVSAWGIFLPLPELHGEQARRFCSQRFRLVLAAWIDNVCSVGSPRYGRLNWEKLSNVLLSGTKAGRGKSNGGEGMPHRSELFDEALLDEYERHVCENVAELHETILRQSDGHDRLWATRDWLEQVLPLFVLPEFAPDTPSALIFRANFSPRLRERWLQSERLLLQRRSERVREAVESSDAYRAVSSRGTPTASERWLRKACNGWFKAVEPGLEGRLELLRASAPPPQGTSPEGHH
jgi:hypothetical protein